MAEANAAEAKKRVFEFIRMSDHKLPLTVENLHDHYSAALAPVLAIDSGDSVTFETLDVSWTTGPRYDFVTPPPYHEKPDHAIGDGPALSGPIFVRGASPGDMLEVQIIEVRPKNWGWTCAGGRSKWPDLAFDADNEAPAILNWAIDVQKGVACVPSGLSIGIRPFMGMMGVCPAGDIQPDAWSPSSSGGNLDCKELVAGTSLFLPVGVAGALFSTGDGHAVQGDGELCGCAIECGMERVRLRFIVHKTHEHPFIHARSETEMITFGFAENLQDALAEAGNRMIDFLIAEYEFSSRAEALCLSSCVVDFRVTQVANPKFGIHAVLKLDAIGRQ